jgi:hypothetical protein
MWHAAQFEEKSCPPCSGSTAGVLAANAGEMPSRLMLIQRIKENREMGLSITISFAFLDPIHFWGQKKSPVSNC